MSYKILWTDEARHTLQQNLDYLQRKWDQKTIDDFLDRVDEILTYVKANPRLFPAYYPKESIHKCIINKRIILSN